MIIYVYDDIYMIYIYDIIYTVYDIYIYIWLYMSVLNLFHVMSPPIGKIGHLTLFQNESRPLLRLLRGMLGHSGDLHWLSSWLYLAGVNMSPQD